MVVASSGTLPRMSESLQRYRMKIAYDGSQFHGWQRQEPPDGPPLRTVQGEIEQILTRLLRQPIVTCGASRTDAGVHALGQVAHFDAACPIPKERLAEAINGRMPDDIDVISVDPVSSDFDAIRDVVNKEYCYRLHNTVRKPLVERHCVYHCWTTIDSDRMHEAAQQLIGEHDFAGFAAADHGRTTTVRTIHECRVQRNGDDVRIYVSGDGFLYNMVRIIAGTLVEIGRGRFEPSVIEDVLNSKDRRQAGPTLPATGLCLQWIRYRQDESDS